MKKIPVQLAHRSYQILVGEGLIDRLGAVLPPAAVSGRRGAYCLSFPGIWKRFGPKVKRALAQQGYAVRSRVVPDTERSKSLSVATAVFKDLAAYDSKQAAFIVALGGGVIGDLAGFVASTYRRGIPYVQVPTTLLAQVDSSIGGKTGVDLPEGKNLVGTFYQPRLVVSDVAALSSLPARQMRSGLAEVIKYGVLSGGGLFAFLEKHLQDVLRHDRASLEAVVGACARIKAGIVSRDEQEEKSLRTHLNFGHTIGHAIESAAGYRRYTHGEAVALGMLCACDISRALGLTGADAGLKVEGLIRQSGLPFVIEGLNASQIIAAHYHDKKFSGAENRFVLVRDIGRTAIVKNVPLPVIAAAVKNRLST